MSKPVTAQELLEHVNQLLASKRPEEDPQQEGLVVSLFALRGGLGKTTLAVNLAGALSRQGSGSVCLVDLSPSNSQASLHLRLQPSTSWADLSAETAQDWGAIEERLLEHPSGIRLLAAPNMPRSPNRPAGSIAGHFLSVLRQHTGFTVVDLPAMLNSAVLAALQASDIVLHVVAPEVIAVQAALHSNRALGALQPGIGQKVYVLNQTTAEAQLPLNAVERGLSTRLVFQAGFDPQQSRALAQGKPLSLTEAQTPLTITLERIAKALRQQAAELARAQ